MSCSYSADTVFVSICKYYFIILRTYVYVYVNTFMRVYLYMFICISYNVLSSHRKGRSLMSFVFFLALRVCEGDLNIGVSDVARMNVERRWRPQRRFAAVVICEIRRPAGGVVNGQWCARLGIFRRRGYGGLHRRRQQQRRLQLDFGSRSLLMLFGRPAATPANSLYAWK